MVFFPLFILIADHCAQFLFRILDQLRAVRFVVIIEGKLGSLFLSTPQMFGLPNLIILTIASLRMHRSLVNFASSDEYDTLFSPLSTAYVVLGHMRVPK
jgi:hypothetical protein